MQKSPQVKCWNKQIDCVSGIVASYHHPSWTLCSLLGVLFCVPLGAHMCPHFTLACSLKVLLSSDFQWKLLFPNAADLNPIIIWYIKFILKCRSHHLPVRFSSFWRGWLLIIIGDICWASMWLTSAKRTIFSFFLFLSFLFFQVFILIPVS